MELYEVIRPFHGERTYQAGEVVDATGWRTTRQLEAQRYIRRHVPVAMQQAAPRSTRSAQSAQKEA